jgi:hypothetical protein
VTVETYLHWVGYELRDLPADLAVTREDFSIRYSFLWRTATASIALEEPLTISFSKAGCPPPKNPDFTP